MKLSKRLLALLLTLSLAFTLALPAFAEDEPDLAMPVVAVQPSADDAPDDPEKSSLDGFWDRAQDFLLLLFAETPLYGAAMALYWLFAPVTVPFTFFFPFGPLLLPLLVLAPVIWPFVLFSEFLSIFGIGNKPNA